MSRLPLCAPLVLLLASCGGGPKAKGPGVGPATTRISTGQQRESLAVTIYNQDFGLVREVRTVDIGTGRIALEMRDVSSQVEPNTVAIKSDGKLDVLEQNYRYDVLTPQKLLQKYEGKKIKVLRYNKEAGKDESFDADVIEADNGPVLEINGEVTFGFPWRYSFPEVPLNLIPKPTLVWLLDSGTPKQKIEVSYLSGGLGWDADYVLSVGSEADDSPISSADLLGWVTLRNNTATSFEDAKLKLVAGDVQRVGRQKPRDEEEGEMYEKDKKEDSGFKEESFFEYHLYALDRPSTLLANEQKQLVLLTAEGIKVRRRLMFFGAAQYYRGNYGQVVSNQKIGVYLEIENTEANHMGMPLPRGTVRVYKSDKSGMRQFIGEDNIDHTPRDEKLKIKMGESFDLVGDRKQKNFKIISNCISESDWEISLRNHKDKAEEIDVIEPMGGEWTVLQSSIPFTKEDAFTAKFVVKVAARKEEKLTYRVRVKWC